MVDEVGHSSAFVDVYDVTTDHGNPILVVLRRYGTDQWPAFAVAVGTTILDRALSLAAPYLLGVLLDGLFLQQEGLSVAFVPNAWIPTGTSEQLSFLFGLFALVAVGDVLTTTVGTLSWRWFRGSILHTLRTDTFDATQRLSVAFFEASSTGDVMSVLNNDVNQLGEFFESGLRDVVEVTAFVVALVVVMVLLHWQLALVAVAFAPSMVVAVRVYDRTIAPRYRERRETVGALNTRVENAVSGVETVKAFTAEDEERVALVDRSRAFWRADWRAARVSAAFFGVRGAISQAAWLAVVIVGGWWALFGPPLAVLDSLSVGTFVTFYFYVSLFLHHTARLGDITDIYADARASAERVLGLLEHPATESDTNDAAALDSVDGRVRFSGVTFTYPGADSPAIRNMSFAVDSGEFVGIIGPTGAGKSTALKLLLRFYDPDSGTVSVDGHDVADVAPESLRDAIGYVSQEPFLFDGTVAENIAYGTPDATRSDVVDAAKRANADEFVSDLSHGYDTRIGEDGAKLSGGQRQRIAIARAVLRDPDLLLLDEATSHVDNRTELLVQESLADLVDDRTTFAVAHRLSTVRQADTLLVFEDGDVIERGTHDELLAADGRYADLWRIHVGTERSASDLS